MCHVYVLTTHNLRGEHASTTPGVWCMRVCVTVPSILNANLHLSIYSVWAHQPGPHRRKANTVLFFLFLGENDTLAHIIVCYIITAEWRACVCVQAGVCLRACVSVCALLLNLCYICMDDAMCARVCV